MVARIGGDEFAILLPCTDSKTSESILNRLKQLISEQAAETPQFPLKISLGTATAEKEGLKQAFIEADRQMYANKAQRKF